MPIDILALTALVIVIIISAIRTDLNTGLLSIAFAYVIGVYFAGLTVAEVSTYLPEQLVLTLVGVTLLFEMAHENGTLDKLAGLATRSVRGHPTFLPIVFFLFTFVFSAIGPGNIAAVALIAPIGMVVAINSGINPLVMAIMICTGANAGAFSPVALTGIINTGLMNEIGINDPNITLQIFLLVAGLQSISALLAYFLFGGYRISQTNTNNQTFVQPSIEKFNKQQIITLISIFALIISVIVFKVSVTVGTFVIAGLLGLFKIGNAEKGLQHLPWGIISLVAGISVLVGLLETTGGLDLATNLLAAYSSTNTINGLLAFVTGLISIYSSSSGVVMPTFIPLLPSLIQTLGGGDLIKMIVAVNVGSHLVDVSPLSTLGALCLAALPENFDKSIMFRRLLLWGISMSILGGLLAFIFLDLL
jgi:Na+/H+ antiporter NhaD/arsenite permease-like protein